MHFWNLSLQTDVMQKGKERRKGKDFQNPAVKCMKSTWQNKTIKPSVQARKKYSRFFIVITITVNIADADFCYILYLHP